MREKLWEVPLVRAPASLHTVTTQYLDDFLPKNGRSLAEASGTVHETPVNKIQS